MYSKFHPADFWRATLDSLVAHVAILDENGTIIAVNQSWRRFATDNDQPHPDACIGVNYVAVCEKATEQEPHAAAIIEGIRAVQDGRRRDFFTSYPCHSPLKKRWFMLRVSRFEGPPPGRLVIAHENITAPMAARARALRFARELEGANRTLIAQAQELSQAAAVEADRSRILALIARNEILETVLHEIALSVEHHSPEVCCAIIVRRHDSLAVITTADIPDEKLRFLSGNAALILASCRRESAFGLIRLAEAVQGTTAQANAFLAVPINKQSAPHDGCLAITGRHSALPPKASPVFEGAASLAGACIDHVVLYERLSFQANHDALTAVPNRILFSEFLQQAVASGKRQKTSFGLLLLDLDRFKHINDIYGHQAADALLRQVSRRLADVIRPEDKLARLGGDEFAILLGSCPSAEAAEAAAQKICAALREPFDVLQHELRITCSIGFSLFPQDATETASLIHNADTARLDGKRKGGNSWRCYSVDLGMALNEVIEIERHLQHAIRNEELRLHYQAQTDIHRNIVGAEALMRWNCGALGAVSPIRFIPVAEQSGLILELGTWALHQACLQWKRWQAAGFRPIQIAVNVSTVQLRDGDFGSKVREIIERTHMDPRYLELEVTESAMMDNMKEAITEMEKVRAQGVKVSIDDFGTGYSSLSYLQRLPVDSVKIDQSFVRHLTKDSLDAISVVQAIITLAHNLGLRVVAEGVETEAQMQILTDLNCDVIQGYLLYKPLDASTFGRVLEKRNRYRASGNLVGALSIS